ncbi:2-dehydropantoate 2-reductase (plasmid) [Coraliomargarita sp. W4R53]
MPTIAIVGAGAIGGITATRLAQNPDNDVTVAVRTPVADLVVEFDGEQLTANPRVLTTVAEATPADWVLVATKSYDAAGAASWFAGLVGAQTRVAILQNGVEHVERFESFVDRERIVPVIVDIPAAREAPGRYVQHREALMTVPDSASGIEFAALFDGAGVRVVVTPDFVTAAWQKLCANSAGAVPTALLGPVDMSDPDNVALLRAVVEETVAVGNAEGATLDDSIVEEVLEGFRNALPGVMNSMHADRAAGRPMELDARNGVIVRKGALRSIPTPANSGLVEQLAPFADGSTD